MYGYKITVYYYIFKEILVFNILFVNCRLFYRIEQLIIIRFNNYINVVYKNLFFFEDIVNYISIFDKEFLYMVKI